MKKNIALITGGYSGESVISYKSAKTISRYLDRSRYNVFLVDIRPDGWKYVQESGMEADVNRNDFSITEDGKKINFDAVFIGMHGSPGEDGKLQGYFEMLNIPFTGCDAATSVITFNKRYATAIAGTAGIRVARSVLYHKHSYKAVAEGSEHLHFPVFVKPNNGGSSIGMSKVDQPGKNLLLAIEKAFCEDDQVLVEEMVQGREFTVGVFRSGAETVVLPLTEVRAHPDQSFFDFEAKYQGKSDETTPAVVDEDIAEKIRTAARKVYEVFNCRGVIRIDFIYNEESGQPFMLEVNTIPGQSEASIIPQQVTKMGWSLQEFYTKLLEQALA